MWREVSNTLVSEFADISNAAEVTRITVRLLMAAILGCVLGFEREQRGKSAGVRTHMLVAIGAALFVLIPQQNGLSDSELARVLQGLIAGVGFLGAGTIVKGNHESNIQGLTTAAGIWLTAAIGVAVGLGKESTAILSTILALMILSATPKFIHLLGQHDDSSKEGDADQ